MVIGCLKHGQAFLSTPSARRATTGTGKVEAGAIISIHALREEGDGRKRYLGANGGDISIHALREEGDVRILCPPLIPR